MNKTIKLLMFSDIFVLTGFGLIDPILAIFIKENLIGGTIFAAGTASMLFLIVKSIVQLPFSRYIDSHDSKKIWLLTGTFIVTLVPVIYLFAENITQIYLAQILFGIGSGLVFPTWLSLWSVNLDRQKEGFEWSLYSTMTGLGTALSAAIGGAIANMVGFRYVFFLVGMMSLLGCLILIFLEEKHMKMSKIEPGDYHKKEQIMR